MRHLRGLPAAVRLHATAAWYCASIAAEVTRELISDLTHRDRPRPS